MTDQKSDANDASAGSGLLVKKLQQVDRAEYEALLECERAMGGAPMPYERAEELLYRYNDSYERLGEVVRYSHLMARRSWLKLLGEAWNVCDNIWLYQAELAMLLPNWPCLLMMDADERARLRALPNVVRIYRGCSESNEDGLAWSLNKSIAARFPTFARYHPPEGEKPMLVTATVQRSRIVAVKLGRQEDEVITCHARPIEVTAI